MIGTRFLRSVAALLLVGGLGVGPPSSDSTVARPPYNSLAAVCDYGIALAFRGELASAETTFIDLLSSVPRDARALTNLGNVHLLRGELKDALGFFRLAQRSDGKDPGIVLNRAIVHMLLGEDQSALDAAGAAIELAGGLDAAASLLGYRLNVRPSDSVKTSDRVYLSKSEILTLLETAAAATPVDSLSTSPPATAPPAAGGKSRKRIWRSAGARAGETRETAAMIYWKR